MTTMKIPGNRKYDVMVAGHLCLDIIPHFFDTSNVQIDQIICPGKLINVGQIQISTGGPVSNVGISMKKLGNNVCFCASVGDDELGKLTVERLRKNGNPKGIHLKKGVPSSYTIVIAPPNIDRIFLHNPGTNNEFSSDDLDINLIAQCRHFHFGYPPLMAGMFNNEGSDLQKVFQIAKEVGATTSCDMSLPDPASASGKAPWKKILENILPYVDIFLPSVEEILYMIYPDRFLGMKEEYSNAELIDHLTASDYSSLSDEVLEMGTKMVSLKSGHRGFYIKTTFKERFNDMGDARPSNLDNWSSRELWAGSGFCQDDFYFSGPAVNFGLLHTK